MDLERLCDLYFELSNEDRLQILYVLAEESMNVTNIARELEITTQECSRHISRMSNSKLVVKDPGGYYDLTQFGRLSLRLLTGQKFVVEHRDYFNAHSLEVLPLKYVSRIGELERSELTQDVMVTFSIVESLFRNAVEYLWMIHNRYLLSILPLGAEALKRGVKIHSLEPFARESKRSLDDKRPQYINEDDEDLFIESWKEGKIEPRFCEDIDLFLYVSEKEAIIAFPLSDKSFDYLGFFSKDPVSLKYCREVFNHYWQKGESPSKEKVIEAYDTRKQIHKIKERNG
jgi:predicted transcriptional regulator